MGKPKDASNALESLGWDVTLSYLQLRLLLELYISMPGLTKSTLSLSRHPSALSLKCANKAPSLKVSTVFSVRVSFVEVEYG